MDFFILWSKKYYVEGHQWDGFDKAFRCHYLHVATKKKMINQCLIASRPVYATSLWWLSHHFCRFKHNSYFLNLHVGLFHHLCELNSIFAGQPIHGSPLRCGDGVASLVVNQPGRYRVSAQTRTIEFGCYPLVI